MSSHGSSLKAANLSEHMGLTQVVYATASPYKFAKEISAAAGLVIDDNQLINNGLLNLVKRSRLQPTIPNLSKFYKRQLSFNLFGL